MISNIGRWVYSLNSNRNYVSFSSFLSRVVSLMQNSYINYSKVESFIKAAL